MKKLRPGQITCINGTYYRAKKRTFDCDGCDLNDPFICPNLKFTNQQSEQQIDCLSWGIILIKEKP